MLRFSVPLIALFVNAALTVAIFRLKLLPLLKAVYAGFIAGVLALFALELTAGSLNCAVPDLFVYCALGYCHFHFINLGETARRIRILRELCENPGGLLREELMSRYNARGIVAARLARLAGNGQLVLKDGRYVSGGRAALAMARVLGFMKRALLRRSDDIL
jgi:hypothetical protein